MATVGKLVFEIRADSSALQRDMRDATRHVQQAQKDADKLAESMGKVDGSMQATAASTRDQSSQLGSLTKKTAEVAAAHTAWHGVQTGVNKALGRTSTQVVQTSAATVAFTKVTTKAGAALRSAGAAAATFGRKMLAVAKVLALPALGVGAAIGLVALNRRLLDLGADGAAVDTVSDSFDRLARHVGTTGDALRSDLQSAVRNTVGDIDLMKTSVIALNSEAIKSPEVLAEIAESARILGRTVDLETTDAFDNIVRGIGLMNPQLLKSVGVLVSVDEATRGWAEANNVAVSSMTDAQKHAAFLEAVMEELRAATGRVGESTDDLETSQERGNVALQNFATGIATAVSESENLREVGEDFADIKVAVLGLAESMGGQLLNAVADVSAGFVGLVSGPLADFISGAEEAAEAVERFPERADPTGMLGVHQRMLQSGLGGRPGVPGRDGPTSADLRGQARQAFMGVLEESRDFNQQMNEALGGAFDVLEADARATRTAIEDLIRFGFDPASEAVQQLVRDLEAMRVLQEVTAQAPLGGVRGPGIRGPAGPVRPRRTIDFSLGSDAPFAGGGGNRLQQIDAAVRATAALADATGELDEEARGAVRGISDFIGGLSQIRSGGGGFSTALGAVGVAGGAISVLTSLPKLFGGQQQALDENTKALRRLTETFSGRADLARALLDVTDTEGPEAEFDALLGVFEDIMEQFTLGPGQRELGGLMGGFQDLLQGLTPENIGDVAEEFIRSMLEGGAEAEAITRLAREMGFEGAQQLIDFLVELENLEDGFGDLNDAVSDLTGAFNVARHGFKFDLAHFRARDFDVPGGGGGGGATGGGLGDTGSRRRKHGGVQPGDDTSPPLPLGDTTIVLTVDGRALGEIVLDESTLRQARGDQTTLSVRPRRRR